MRSPIAALVAAAGALVAGCSAPASMPPGPTDCPAVVDGPLPEWARTGFSPPNQDVTYVEGERGDIVAVLFGYPLEVAATGAGSGEKILWVGRVLDDAPADLVVRGRSGQATMNTVIRGGPGPSSIDVPVAGCWTMNLTWGSHRDVVRLAFGPATEESVTPG